jgi:hypothetical protein
MSAISEEIDKVVQAKVRLAGVLANLFKMVGVTAKLVKNYDPGDKAHTLLPLYSVGLELSGDKWISKVTKILEKLGYMGRKDRDGTYFDKNGYGQIHIFDKDLIINYLPSVPFFKFENDPNYQSNAAVHNVLGMIIKDVRYYPFGAIYTKEQLELIRKKLEDKGDKICEGLYKVDYVFFSLYPKENKAFWGPEPVSTRQIENY